MNRFSHVLRLALWPIAITLALLSGTAVSAAATSEIEGVWSFEGGQVAITHAAGGKFVGIVVNPTKFAECTHRAGEEMWTDVTPQTNGSYWGLHQWLFDGSCLPNPERGPTAWRVLQTSTGSRYLEVCFSEPGNVQPAIAANGTSTGSIFGCRQSAPTAPLPVVSKGGGSERGGAERITFPKTVLLPNPGACIAKNGSLRIKLRNPKYDPLKEVLVWVRGRRVADVRGVQRLKRGIVLRHLPTGNYKIKVLAITVLRQKLSGHLTYHSCGKRSLSGAVQLRRHPRPRGR
ncbi:MAG: hypothetical protein ACRDLF_00970 [Solirubrobacteraceae bacterium]